MQVVNSFSQLASGLTTAVLVAAAADVVVVEAEQALLSTLDEYWYCEAQLVKFE